MNETEEANEVTKLDASDSVTQMKNMKFSDRVLRAFDDPSYGYAISGKIMITGGEIQSLAIFKNCGTIQQGMYGTIDGGYIQNCTLRTSGEGGSLSIGSDVVLVNCGTISGGTISGASICGGTVSGSSICGGTVCGSTISGASICGGTITNADFCGSMLSGSISSSVSFPSSLSLVSPLLSGASISGGSISGASITSGYIFGASISGGSISGASITGGSIGSDVSLPSNLSLSGPSICGGSICGSNLCGVLICGDSVQIVSICGSGGYVDICGCDLSDCNISGGSISGADITYGTISGSTLYNATFYYGSGDPFSASMQISNGVISGAVICGGTICGATLDGVQVSLDGATANNMTLQYPPSSGSGDTPYISSGVVCGMTIGYPNPSGSGDAITLSSGTFWGDWSVSGSMKFMPYSGDRYFEIDGSNGITFRDGSGSAEGYISGGFMNNIGIIAGSGGDMYMFDGMVEVSGTASGSVYWVPSYRSGH